MILIYTNKLIRESANGELRVWHVVGIGNHVFINFIHGCSNKVRH